MRKSLIFIFAVLFIFASCSKEDELEIPKIPVVGEQSEIVGQWLFKKITAEIDSNNSDAAEGMIDVIENGEVADTLWEFDADGRYRSYNSDKTEMYGNGVYKIEDDRLLLKNDSETFVKEFIFKVNGDVFVYSSDITDTVQKALETVVNDIVVKKATMSLEFKRMYKKI